MSAQAYAEPDVTIMVSIVVLSIVPDAIGEASGETLNRRV